MPQPPESAPRWLIEVFAIFLRLGCTSFGGPIAHLGYFETEFVQRRKWLRSSSFSELVALAQSLPGPASSQVGYSIGLLHAGVPGGIAAWLGFTTPSVLIMLAFAFGHSIFNGPRGAGFLHGLQLAAVAVVAQAVLTMQRTLAPDWQRFTIALIAAAFVLWAPFSSAALFAILMGLAAGQLLLNSVEPTETDNQQELVLPVSKRMASCSLVLFGILLAICFLLPAATLSPHALFVSFYRVGSLVFGGGHVVLPLLEAQTVARGWISQEHFLAGYGAAQALPGPLFAFGAYVGAAVQPNLHPVLDGLLSVVAIFLPGLLLMTGVLPFWHSLRRKPQVQRSLRGINAAVVGILIAALYNPVWKSTVHSPYDFLIALGAFIMLVRWRTQPWIVVLLAGSISALRL